jgi:hypothetical protein
MEPENTSFKERVRKDTIRYAAEYQNIFINYDYLVISDAFQQKYHIVKAWSDNYMHLTGVHSSLPATDFFQKCLDGTLSEADFDFKKPGLSEKSVKGTVREKIKALPDFCNMFSGTNIYCQEYFHKGKAYCTFASTDGIFTIGFIEEGKPQTLMKNNQLDMTLAQPAIVILRKKREEPEFREVILGDSSSCMEIIDMANQQIVEGSGQNEE